MSKSGFVWQDLLGLEGILSDEERMIRDQARAFCDQELKPTIRETYRAESYDPEIIRAMGKMGMLGCTIDGWGCAGISYTGYGLLCQELERIDSALRSTMSVQSSLVMHPIHTYGSDAQKDQYLPGLMRGDLVGCFGLTEPDGGSDPGSMKTRARRDGDDYILHGEKTWIS
ncbi:MAG: acyl-CoA dehydrogenase family protein, partial [Pseudomonadota bacterium]